MVSKATVRKANDCVDKSCDGLTENITNTYAHAHPSLLHNGQALLRTDYAFGKSALPLAVDGCQCGEMTCAGDNQPWQWERDQQWCREWKREQ
jgi:hypothetical protein